jgi:hypothetical protein
MQMQMQQKAFGCVEKDLLTGQFQEMRKYGKRSDEDTETGAVGNTMPGTKKKQQKW